MLRKSTGERQQPHSCSVSAASANGSRGKKIWTVEEDEQLRILVETHGTGNWTLIAESLPDRTGKQCRERWHNHLGAGIKKGEWTEQEDRIIITMQQAIGNQWAKITKVLPGRTDNAVKNRFHATERAKVRGKFDESLYAVPIDEKFIQELKDLNGGEVDLQDLYEAGALKPPLDQLYIVQATASAQPQYPQATVYMPPEQQNYRFDNSDFAAGNNEVKEEDFDDAMDMEADGGNDMEQDPIDGLLDLDIISFDENDMAFSFDIVDEKEQTRNAGCGPELQACCFSYFDWGCTSANVNAHENQNAQPQRNNYMCGLEAWSSRSQQQPQSIHNAQDAMSMQQQQYQQQQYQQDQVQQYQQQQYQQHHQMQQYPQQQQMVYNNYGEMPCAPQQPVMQQQYQMPPAPTHHPTMASAPYQIKQESYAGTQIPSSYMS